MTNAPTEKKLNAQEILEKLTELRKRLPEIADLPRTSRGNEGRSMFPDGMPAETEEDFEYAAVIDALQSMADDVDAIIARKKQRALESALEIYYVMEQLARDPAHADLLPRLEEMRSAYQREFGKAIPDREQADGETSE